MKIRNTFKFKKKEGYNLSLYRTINKLNYKRKSLKEHRKMTKKELLNNIWAYFACYDKLQKLFVDKCLEIEFLNRKNNMLQNRINFLCRGRKRTFRDVDTRRYTPTRRKKYSKR